MPRRLEYTTCCVDSDAESIHDMVDRAREVTYQTLRKHCDGVDQFAAGLGYDTGNERGGLRLKDDFAVSFHKSLYRGKPCYYVDHSRIEYIWT